MGPDIDQLRSRLADHQQEHVLAFWEELSPAEESELSASLAEIDLDEIEQLLDRGPLQNDEGAAAERATGPSAVQLDDPGREEAAKEAIRRGSEALAAGRVGVLIVAGGQGTRLGFEHPKGMFPVGPDSGRTLFEIFIHKQLEQATAHNTAIPLYLMTSPATHDETVDFLQKHDRFGLPEEDLHIFCQGTMPAVDATTRKLLLATKGSLALSPDGHGGMVSALKRTGLLDDMQQRGIRHLFYMQVDNPLVAVADPEFLGHHLNSNSEISTQVVRKTDPAEKVGNVVTVDDRLQIIEYSDLPEEAAQRRDASGELELWAGNIAVHAIEVDFLRHAAEHLETLPWHFAQKSVPYIDASGKQVTPSEPNAFKFERFVFDLLPHAKNAIAIEVPRETAFAPLKSADDLETVREQLRKHEPRWL